MSDEADRIRAYQDLAKRGQPVFGKNFGTGVTPKLKKTPKVKTIDTTKMKQIKLLKRGGETDPLKGVATMLANIQKGGRRRVFDAKKCRKGKAPVGEG